MKKQTLLVAIGAALCLVGALMAYEAHTPITSDLTPATALMLIGTLLIIRGGL